jgi:hypothetical protein
MADSKHPTIDANRRQLNERTANGSPSRAGLTSGMTRAPFSNKRPAPPVPLSTDYGSFIDGGEVPIVDDLKEERVGAESNSATFPRNTADSGRTGVKKPEEPKQTLPVAQVAANLKDGPTILALRAAGMGSNVPVEGWRLYLDDFVRRAGSPSDPVEKLMVEQLALAHNAICKLYVRAASADDAALSEVCFAALARLLAEFRRLTLALKEYRGPALSQVVNMVEQQNVAVGGNQQIANLEGGVATSPGKNNLTNELTSKHHPHLEHEVQQQFIAQPAASSRREIESAKTLRSDARRAPAVARSGACQPPVDEIDGTSISGR